MKPFRTFLTFVLLIPALVQAQALPTATPVPTPTLPSGFEKPAAAEREAYGYDPEGMEYHQTKSEDFQVILVETAPFAAAISYGGAILTSLARRGTGTVNKGYFIGFIVSTVVLSALAATYGISGKPYSPKAQASLSGSNLPPLAFEASLVQVTF